MFSLQKKPYKLSKIVKVKHNMQTAELLIDVSAATCLRTEEKRDLEMLESSFKWTKRLNRI